MNTTGVVTIQVLKDDASQLFREAEESFPEFKPGAVPKVLGGFAAYANPSSFHCPLVKSLRKITFDAVIKSGVFREYLKEVRPDTWQQFRLELLFDRMMHRYPEQKPIAETAHRDVTPGNLLVEEDDDLLFGGWLNPTSQNQYFVGKPGSHIGIRNTFQVSRALEGFCKLDTKSQEYQEYKKSKQKFKIPPGHLIIFPQHLLHEVLSQKGPEQFRLFFGWRLTKSRTTLFPEKAHTIDTLGVPRIPSGQIPPMYSSNHGSIFKNNPFSWIGDDKRGSLVEWWDRSLKVPFSRFLNSLEYYNIDYPGYSQEERDLMLNLHPI